MSGEELNKYRLTSLEEPTDEMLAAIMKEVAEDVRAKNEATDKQFMDQLRENAKKDKLRLGI